MCLVFKKRLKKENMQTKKKGKAKRIFQSKRVTYSLKEKNKGKRMPEKKISAYQGGGGIIFGSGPGRYILGPKTSGGSLSRCLTNIDNK
jgi:hypothetical protein